MPSSATTTQEELRTRSIPHMTLSTGDASSMTGPPPPMPHYLTAEGRAIKRFAVEGNAICTSTHVSRVPHLFPPSPPECVTLTRSLSSHRRRRNPCPRERACLARTRPLGPGALRSGPLEISRGDRGAESRLPSRQSPADQSGRHQRRAIGVGSHAYGLGAG